MTGRHLCIGCFRTLQCSGKSYLMVRFLVGVRQVYSANILPGGGADDAPLAKAGALLLLSKGFSLACKSVRR